MRTIPGVRPAALLAFSLTGCATLASFSPPPQRGTVDVSGLVDAPGDGSHAFVRLVVADGVARAEVRRAPREGPSELVTALPDDVAHALALEAERLGAAPRPLDVVALVRRLAPDALAGFPQTPPPFATPEPDASGTAWRLPGASGTPLLLAWDGDAGAVQLRDAAGGPSVTVASLSPGAAPYAAGLVLLGRGRAVLAAGEARAGEGVVSRADSLWPLDLARGEAMLHNTHALAHYAAGDLSAALRELSRAVAADATCVDAQYNLASLRALTGDEAGAVEALRLAATLDPRRVALLAAGDDDLRDLRRRADVREILQLPR